MNYREETYPSSLNSLLDKARLIAGDVIEKLNFNNCPSINDLYFEQNKTFGVQPEHSVNRNKNVFNRIGYVPNTKSGKSKSLNEFKGLYIFGEVVNDKVIPVYIGISRTVYRRLRQHGFGKRHNECSLAYLMTREQWKTENKIAQRETITNNDLIPSKEKVKEFKVTLYPVLNDFDLYFLEIALAGIFKTKWNSFRTH